MEDLRKKTSLVTSDPHLSGSLGNVTDSDECVGEGFDEEDDSDTEGLAERFEAMMAVAY